MKRSGPPKRRTPLRAKARLRSKGAGRAAATAAIRERSPGEPRRTAAPDPGSGVPPRARARIRARSAKREERRDDERDAKLALYARDGGRCLLEGRAGWGPCAGRWTPHHLRKQHKGWDWALDNLVTACVAHNEAVERRPLEAHALGLVVREGDTKEEAWCRLKLNGLVR